jgi:hypothetical protein
MLVIDARTVFIASLRLGMRNCLGPEKSEFFRTLPSPPIWLAKAMGTQSEPCREFPRRCELIMMRDFCSPTDAGPAYRLACCCRSGKRFPGAFPGLEGNEQRVYPWSAPPNSTVIDASYAVYSAGGPARVGSRSPKGDGRWGHADLAGNVWQWVRDFYPGSLPNPCIDCAYLTPPWNGNIRGGSFYEPANYLYASSRYNYTGGRTFNVGARCARAP